MKKILSAPIHPVLVAIYPTLFLFSHNFGQLTFDDLKRPLLFCFMSGIFLWAIVNLLIVSRALSAATASIILLAFFSYNPVASYLGKDSSTIWLILALIGLLAIVVVRFLVRRKALLPKLTIIFNLTALGLVAFPTFNIYSKQNLRLENKVYFATIETKDPSSSEQLPDIFYIVIDSYNRADTLKNRFKYDNSEFINFLKSNNFYVAGASYSNYPFTTLSLASSLNMTYLDEFIAQNGADSEDLIPLTEYIVNNQIVQYLKSKGYVYYHFGPRQYLGETNPNADYNFVHNKNDELRFSYFETELINQTPLRDIIELTWPETNEAIPLDDRYPRYLDILETFSELTKINNSPGPKFVFFHSLATHVPYVMDENGNYKSSALERTTSREENYIGQLTYTNKLLTDLIKYLMTAEPKPIVVLQSDEGTYFKDIPLNFAWKDAATEELQEKMGILNAYYLPGQDEELLYPSISPVNSFRLIFNTYFDEQLPLLEDRHFVPSQPDRPYDLLEVTKKIEN